MFYVVGMELCLNPLPVDAVYVPRLSREYSSVVELHAMSQIDWLTCLDDQGVYIRYSLSMVSV